MSAENKVNVETHNKNVSNALRIFFSIVCKFPELKIYHGKAPFSKAQSKAERNNKTDILNSVLTEQLRYVIIYNNLNIIY